MGARPQADVLLVTVTKVETSAVLAAFSPPGREVTPQHAGGRVYFDLGTVNGARVMLTQAEMGSSGLGAAQQAVSKGIAALSPAAVVMVGIAFGVDETRQRIGDVLIAKQLSLYELQRVGTQGDGTAKIVPRGDRPAASPVLVNLFRSAAATWKGAELRFGNLLTGEKLVDDLDFRDQLRALEPEAAGGEMEGAGLYTACHEQKVDWILVKAICDWADGHKGDDKQARQELAAANAAAFVLHALRFVRLDWAARRGGSRKAGPYWPLAAVAVLCGILALRGWMRPEQGPSATGTSSTTSVSAASTSVAPTTVVTTTTVSNDASRPRPSTAATAPLPATASSPEAPPGTSSGPASGVLTDAGPGQTIMRAGELRAGEKGKIRVGNREEGGAVDVETKGITAGNEGQVAVGNVKQRPGTDAGSSIRVKTGDVRVGDGGTIDIGNTSATP